MGHGIERLTDMAVRQAKPDPGKKIKILSDGGCLRLRVNASSKQWLFKVSKTKERAETTIGLGSYPTVSLAEARRKATKLRQIAAQGLDLTIEHKLQKAIIEKAYATTFQSVAEELLEIKMRDVSPSYYSKIEGALKANLYPKIGDLPIARIEPAHLKTALLPVAARGSYDMIRFLLQVSAEVFDYAKVDGRFRGDNPAHALRKNVFPKHKREHMKALPWSEMPGFLHRLDGFYGEFATACCIRLMVWTATRPGEARKAKWSEFDLAEGRWIIPAERMKMKQPHHVPLPKQAITMLRELEEITGSTGFLFPSKRGSKADSISDVALLKAIRRTVGHDDVDAHGFRAVFRTYAAESLKWPEQVLEAALAHGKKNSIVGAYDRATYYNERKKLMQWYADQLEATKWASGRRTHRGVT